MNKSYLSSAEHRTRVILDAYGSRPPAWPDDERQATLDCLARSPILQHYRTQLEELDQRITAAQSDAVAGNADTRLLQQRILDRLPAQSRPTAGNKPAVTGRVRSPRVAIALAGVFVLAMLLSQHHTAPVPRTLSPVSASFAAWSWYDITGQDLPARQASSSLTMTDLIDMETGQDGS